VREARDALRASAAALIPAEDGGYVLIGLAKRVDAIFDGIEWGTDKVLARTRERFATAGVRPVELRPLWDVDRPEDLLRLQREGLAGAAA
jgi:glycosyltransferase A (GT-A) superfamily protein (DUF2064 family)